MREWQSQSHVKWYSRYRAVFTPKYRRELGWSWWRVTRWRTTCTCA